MVQSRNIKDIVGGAGLLAFGLYFVVQGSRYPIGTLAMMGAGFFPVVLGAVVCVLSLAILWRGLRLPGEPITLDGGVFLSVLGGVLAFYLLFRPFGLAPALLGLTAVGAFAVPRPRPVPVLVSAGILILFSWLVFRLALGLSLPLWKLP